MIDLGPLVKGLMVVIGIAIATGHYGDLQRWARHEALESLLWKDELPGTFHPPIYRTTLHKDEIIGSGKIKPMPERH